MTEPAARKRLLIEALYRKYHRALRGFVARRRFTDEEAADIVQETYRRLHQFADVESISHPRAFLFRVASNLAHNSEKRRRFVGEPEETGELEVAAEDPGPYRQLKGEQELALVRRAFEELSPKCRRAFVMNRFENLSYPQIARELDVSVSMIEKYISQALAHLKRRLADARAGKAAASIVEGVR